MKHSCDNCGTEITGTPIEGEEERNIIRDGIEMDCPVMLFFCSQECKREYFENN